MFKNWVLQNKRVGFNFLSDVESYKQESKKLKFTIKVKR